MNAVLKRIKEIAQQEGISVTALEAAIGASKGVFSRALANGTDIQSKWLVRIIENYPQYSSEWLLSGKGEMQKISVVKDVRENYATGVSDEPQNEMVQALKKVIASQETTIRSQELTIGTLQKRIIELEKTT